MFMCSWQLLFFFSQVDGIKLFGCTYTCGAPQKLLGTAAVLISIVEKLARLTRCLLTHLGCAKKLSAVHRGFLKRSRGKTAKRDEIWKTADVQR